VNVPPPGGRLEVVHGSMFAGKTEHLIARLRAEEARGQRVRAFKHAIDSRYAPTHLATHGGDQFEARRVSTPDAILEQAGDVDVIAIDEGQFFKQPLVAVVRALKARGLTVLVAGIPHDAWGRPFDPMPELVARADEVVLRQAPCRVCGCPAPYTQRMTAITTEFMIGGLPDYEPRCAVHFVSLPGPPEPR
jgi:thymidine kinase